MSERIVCAGHPRDMGLAQGRQLRAVIASAVARAGLSTRRSRWPSLRAVASGPVRGRGAGRALFRHFAHQAERLEGLAQAADLPLDSLLELQLQRVASADEHDEEGWFVRESRPVVGFRSLELALPWGVPALAGVNDAGLAVIARTRGSESSASVSGRAEGAPPGLLVQDCLARFEHLAGALDWCRKRPVEGELTLLLGDASGARATVVFQGRERSFEIGSVGASMVWNGGRARIDPVARRLWVDAVDGTRVAAGPCEFGFEALPPADKPAH